MDVTPKSKQPGSLKRRPLGLSRSAKTKLLKADGSISESQDKAGTVEGNENPNSEMAASVAEQPCTPVRRSSFQNELSPQYPHMFRIFHDESPEFRVGWDDGISETVTRKETPFFDSSIQSRTIASQNMKRPLKRFPTPPRLKQQPVTADVMEYMQWAKNLVEKAQTCTSQTPSPSEVLPCNSTLETGTNNSSCNKTTATSSTSSKDLLDRRSLPVINCDAKENLEINRKSLPAPQSHFSDFFDDSANDDMFMRCSQAVEDSLLKDTNRKSVDVLTVNNNIISSSKVGIVKPHVIKEVAQCAVKNPSFVPVKKALINTFPSQANERPTPSNKEQIGALSSNPTQSTVKPSAICTPLKLSDVCSHVFVTPSEASRNSSLKSDSSSSSKDSGIDIQLLDEDDDFLSSLDLQSLSQMNPPKTISVPGKSTNTYKNTENSAKNVVSSSKLYANPNLVKKLDVKITEINASTSNRTVNCAIKSTNPSVSTSNRITAPVNHASNAAKLCTQDVIKRKREEAQRRLQRNKMQRHDSL